VTPYRTAPITPPASTARTTNPIDRRLAILDKRHGEGAVPAGRSVLSVSPISRLLVAPNKFAGPPLFPAERAPQLVDAPLRLAAIRGLRLSELTQARPATAT